MYSTGIGRGTERRKCLATSVRSRSTSTPTHCMPTWRMQGGGQTERDTHIGFPPLERPVCRFTQFVEDDLGLPYRDRLSLATCRCYRLRSPVGSYQRSLRTQRACRSTRIKELASTTSLRQLTNRKNPFPPPFLTDAWLSQPLVSGFFLISGSLMLYCSMVIGWHLVV